MMGHGILFPKPGKVFPRNEIIAYGKRPQRGVSLQAWVNDGAGDATVPITRGTLLWYVWAPKLKAATVYSLKVTITEYVDPATPAAGVKQEVTHTVYQLRTGAGAGPKAATDIEYPNNDVVEPCFVAYGTTTGTGLDTVTITSGHQFHELLWLDSGTWGIEITNAGLGDNQDLAITFTGAPANVKKAHVR